MKVRAFGFSAVVAALIAALPTSADVITTLYSTGFTNTGALQSEGGVDGNWTITTNPNGSGSTAYVTTTDGFPIGAWIPNSAQGQWIQPTSGTTDTHVPGDYVYQTSFSLAGLNPATAEITLQAAGDNRITGVLLNGFNTGFTWTGPTGSGDAYTAFSPQFVISNPAWFQNGVNTLQFLVTNDSPPNDPTNPTGLLVVMSGTAGIAVTDVPEPSTMALIGLVGGAGWLIRRRRKAAVLA